MLVCMPTASDTRPTLAGTPPSVMTGVDLVGVTAHVWPNEGRIAVGPYDGAGVRYHRVLADNPQADSPQLYSGDGEPVTSQDDDLTYAERMAANSPRPRPAIT